MTIQEVERILWEGTREEIASLLEIGVSYAFYEEDRVFYVGFGCIESIVHKVLFAPACVKHFGPIHDLV